MNRNFLAQAKNTISVHAELSVFLYIRGFEIEGSDSRMIPVYNDDMVSVCEREFGFSRRTGSRPSSICTECTTVPCCPSRTLFCTSCSRRALCEGRWASWGCADAGTASATCAGSAEWSSGRIGGFGVCCRPVDAGSRGLRAVDGPCPGGTVWEGDWWGRARFPCSRILLL